MKLLLLLFLPLEGYAYSEAFAVATVAWRVGGSGLLLIRLYGRVTPMELEAINRASSFQVKPRSLGTTALYAGAGGGCKRDLAEICLTLAQKGLPPF